MANFYIKKIENTNEASEVNSSTQQANGGSILKTNSQVGIFNRAGTNFYRSGLLDENQGKVFSQSGTNFTPTRSNLSNLIQNQKVKSVLSKFFTNVSNTSDESHNTSSSAIGTSNFDNDTNLNAFAYMNANNGIFNEI